MRPNKATEYALFIFVIGLCSSCSSQPKSKISEARVPHLITQDSFIRIISHALPHAVSTKNNIEIKHTEVHVKGYEYCEKYDFNFQGVSFSYHVYISKSPSAQNIDINLHTGYLHSEFVINQNVFFIDSLKIYPAYQGKSYRFSGNDRIYLSGYAEMIHVQDGDSLFFISTEIECCGHLGPAKQCFILNKTKKLIYFMLVDEKYPFGFDLLSEIFYNPNDKKLYYYSQNFTNAWDDYIVQMDLQELKLGDNGELQLLPPQKPFRLAYEYNDSLDKAGLVRLK